MISSLEIIDVKEHLGQLVRTLRKSNSLSQNELADLLDLSRITIQNLESGNNFTIDTFLKVMRHFDLLEAINEKVVAYNDQMLNVKSLY